jgi:curved DNA-binding protein
LKLCLGGRTGSQRKTKFRGDDYNVELHLSLTNAFRTYQQTLTVNGKNIRISIPAGIENGQVTKLKGYGASGANGDRPGNPYITFSIAI